MQPEDINGMKVAAAVATESPDLTKKVGCIITGRDGRILVSGFNAIPDDCTHSEDRLHRPHKYKWTEHAERRVINRAARFGTSVEGGTAYVTYFPCADCARTLVDAGIDRVVAPEPDLHHDRWGESWKDALDILNDACVSITYMEVPADVSE